MSAPVQTAELGSPLPRPVGVLGDRPRQRRVLSTRRAIAGADVLGLAAAYVLTGAAAGLEWPPGARLAAWLVLLPLWLVAAKLLGLYGADEQRIEHSTIDELVAVVLVATLAAWTLFALAFAAGRSERSAAAIVAFWAAAIGAVTLGRSVARAALRRTDAYRQRVLVLGTGDTARLVARKLRQHPEYGVEVLGFVDADGAAEDLLGTTDELPGLVRQLGVERVVVAPDGRPAGETLAAIRSLGGLDVYVDLVPQLHEVVGPNGRIHSVEGLALIDMPPVRLASSTRLLKRAIDVVGALVALALAAPLFVVIPLLIRRESPGPAIFRQTRLGEQMREFTVLKFRTMRVGVDEERHREYIRATMDARATPQTNGLYKLERPEITQVGAFLRRTSLDELPQLVNVLRGEMSLVGPRPCIPYETQFFAPHHFERFLMPAGLTGLWQVTARGRATFGEALDMDVAYVRGWSLGLDLNLLLRTIQQVLTRKGTA